MPFPPISLAAWRWGRITWTVLLAAAAVAAPAAAAGASVSPDLEALATSAPGTPVEVIVRGDAATVRRHGGPVTRRLELIDAVVARMSAGQAERLARREG